MDTRPDHAGSMRVMAFSVARDLRDVLSGVGAPEPTGLSSFFRVHSHWRAHGWYGDPSMADMKDICGRVFADEPDDRQAFVRGLRSAASIEMRDGSPNTGSVDDRDVFWRCVETLGRETGVEMPGRPVERTGPRMHGH